MRLLLCVVLAVWEAAAGVNMFTECELKLKAPKIDIGDGRLIQDNYCLTTTYPTSVPGNQRMTVRSGVSKCAKKENLCGREDAAYDAFGYLYSERYSYTASYLCDISDVAENAWFNAFHQSKHPVPNLKANIWRFCKSMYSTPDDVFVDGPGIWAIPPNNLESLRSTYNQYPLGSQSNWLSGTVGANDWVNSNSPDMRGLTWPSSTTYSGDNVPEGEFDVRCAALIPDSERSLNEDLFSPSAASDGTTFHLLNFPSDGILEPAGCQATQTAACHATDVARDGAKAGGYSKAIYQRLSVFTYPKIFSTYKACQGTSARFDCHSFVLTSIGLVKSSSPVKSGYWALCPNYGWFPGIEIDGASVEHMVSTYCYWSGTRPRQLGLPSTLTFVNSTGNAILTGDVRCEDKYSALMYAIRIRVIPLIRKYSSYLTFA